MTHALIIDDDKMNIDVLAKLLAKLGVGCTSILSPSQLNTGLQTLTELHVIFLDLEMPIEDGYSVHNRLKADPQLSGIPIVAYSVHTNEIDEVRRVGFHSFIGKPLDSRKFPSQLERILNNVSVWESF
jgi:CheY-like chemotaxis protein